MPASFFFKKSKSESFITSSHHYNTSNRREISVALPDSRSTFVAPCSTSRSNHGSNTSLMEASACRRMPRRPWGQDKPLHVRLCTSTLLHCVFSRSDAPYLVVTRRKRSKEKAVPQPDARAHEDGSPSASATGDRDMRSLQQLRRLTSMSSEGCADDSLRHQDVQRHEEEGNGGSQP